MKLPTIADVSAQLQTGKTTSAELVEHCLDTIYRLDSELNSFIAVLADDARAAALEADAQRANGKTVGPLHGIPISVKDLIDLRGTPTTAASRVRTGHLASADAQVIARLRRAGVIFIGKCNLHEFAFGTTGEDSAFGLTRNPHVPGHMPGGSSSGSAVSVATGMALASVGTDTGGSVRIPAAACGVVGLKPSFGEVSCEGVVPLARTLDHVGPLGITVADVDILYRAMQDSDSPVRDKLTKNVRLGLPRQYFLDILDGEVRAVFDATIDRLRKTGCLIETVEIAYAAEIRKTYLYTQLREAFDAHANMLKKHASAYTPNVRERLELGRSVSDADYTRAQLTRDVLRGQVNMALEERQALILPTLSVPAPPLGVTEVTIGEHTSDLRSLMLRQTQLFNLTGHPVISIPCGETSDGLPCAVQLVGHLGKTNRLLSLASRYEPSIRTI